MRQLWISLFCIVFSMSGSLIPASHTVAHAQLADIGVADDHHTHDDNPRGGDPADYQRHAGDHGAELHFTALEVPPIETEVPLPAGELRSVYSDFQYPAPLLPPDPDPDRA
jgi:hypothetical protein